MIHSTRFSLSPATDAISPALAWGERNLTALARHAAQQMTGGDDDPRHLTAVFALLRARQAVRDGIIDLEREARGVAK